VSSTQKLPSNSHKEEETKMRADEYERAPLLNLKGSVRADESAKYKKVGVAAALLFGASVLFSGKEQSSRFASLLSSSGYFSNNIYVHRPFYSENIFAIFVFSYV
jgi:hypothetical protein